MQGLNILCIIKFWDLPRNMSVGEESEYMEKIGIPQIWNLLPNFRELH
jgi:hypothetical protein